MTLEFQEVFYDDVERRVIQLANTCDDKKRLYHSLLNKKSETYQELEMFLSKEYSYTMLADNLYYAIEDAICKMG